MVVPGKCLVYSFGSNANFVFENGIKNRFQCEIHVFDPFWLGQPPNVDRMTVHSWGVAGASSIAQRTSKKGVSTAVTMKSLPDIVKELGHEGKTIDIMKVDVEGFEFGVLDNVAMWDSLKTVGTDFSQVLAEVHSTGINRDTFSWPNSTHFEGREMDNFFRVMSAQGYGIFHKEVNTLPTAHLLCAEYGFVKLNIDCSGPTATTGNNAGDVPSKFVY
jgi:FkbM family methyltransferase